MAKKKKDLNYIERRRRLKNFMREAGSWRVPRNVIQEAAKKGGVSERTIYKDIKKIIQEIPKPDVDEVSKKFILNYEKAMESAMDLLRSDLPEIKAKGVKLFFDAVKSYTDFLESYGYKEKIADKVEHSGRIIGLQWEDQDGKPTNESNSEKVPKAKDSVGDPSGQ